jgi:hypothetical protein
LIGAVALFIGTAGLAGAHEHREVADGQYEMTIGFLNEPAIVEEPNGLDLRVAKVAADEHETEGTPAAGEEDEHAGEPVEGLQDTLQAEVTHAGQTMPLTLRAAFSEPGAYKADFIPTAEGTYTFHIFGTIEGIQIDESFTSGPDTFSEVASRSTMNFPATDGGDSAASAAVEDAQDSADSAQTLAIIGIIAGVLGLAAGVAGVMLARNARTAAAPATAARPADGVDY